MLAKRQQHIAIPEYAVGQQHHFCGRTESGVLTAIPAISLLACGVGMVTVSIQGLSRGIAHLSWEIRHVQGYDVHWKGSDDTLQRMGTHGHSRAACAHVDVRWSPGSGAKAASQRVSFMWLRTSGLAQDFCLDQVVSQIGLLFTNYQS